MIFLYYISIYHINIFFTTVRFQLNYSKSENSMGLALIIRDLKNREIGTVRLPSYV